MILCLTYCVSVLCIVGAYYGNNSIADASRYNTVGNTQYNTTGASGYSPYTQYSNTSYTG